MRKNLSLPKIIIAAPLVMLLNTIVGCDSDAHSEIQDSSASLDEIARVEVDHATLIFTAADEGAIVVAEHAPIDTASPLSFLVGEHEATPLEIFLAVSGTAASVPEELQANHELVWDQRGGPMGAPRVLSLPDERFRTVYESSSAVDCSTDGTWFNGIWGGWGWSWHWYWANSFPFSTNTCNEKYSPWSPSRSNFMTHACNVSVTADAPGVMHVLEVNLGGGAIGVYSDAVAVGYRHTYFHTGVLTEYRGGLEECGGGGSYRLGATAP